MRMSEEELRQIANRAHSIYYMDALTEKAFWENSVKMVSLIKNKAVSWKFNYPNAAFHWMKDYVETHNL